MAHTDRDQMRYLFQHHREVCAKWLAGQGWHAVACACDRFGYRYHRWPEDSGFHRDCRRKERSRAADLMRRARAGHLDWDDLTIAYRRPYYW
jgi:hypothetical protein